MVRDIISFKAWKRPGVQVWVAYFILGLISAGVAIMISSPFPEEIRPQIRVVCFILGMLAIDISQSPEDDESRGPGK